MSPRPFTAYAGSYSERLRHHYGEAPPGLKLIVLLPALNEQMTIVDMVKRVPREIAGFGAVEVMVVDDGSQDRTAELARRAGALVISHPTNLGLAAALATGIDAALSRGADVIVNMDADGQFNPEDIPHLVRLIREEDYGLVTCTRYGDKDLIPDMPWIRKAGGIWMSWLVNHVISGARFTDVSCGFRAYSRETALKLTLFSNFTYTQESLIDLAAKGVRMAEVPLKIRGVRQYGESRVARNLWVYGAQTLTIILRAMRDIRPLTFFGTQAVLFFLSGILMVVWAGFRWFEYEMASPGVWAAIIVGTSSCIIGTIVGVMTLIADQVGRLRRLQEKVLFLTRQQYHDRRATQLEADEEFWDAEESRDIPIQAAGFPEVPAMDHQGGDWQDEFKRRPR